MRSLPGRFERGHDVRASARTQLWRPRTPAAKEALRDGIIRGLAPLTERAYRERPRLRVLCFHDVRPGAGSPFPARMGWLATRYRVVSLADAYLRTGLDSARLNVALTFDDGYAEHAAFAAPVLRELGLPATFFVPSGAIGLTGSAAQRFAETGLRRRSRAFRLMPAEDAAELAAEPLFEIGAHTRNHVDLGVVRDRGLFASEIGDERERLEQVTGLRPRWFAFPFGGAEHVSRDAVAAIAEAGFDAAFTIMPGYWSRAHERYLVGRDSLGVELPLSGWRASLRGGYDPIALLKYRRQARSRGDERVALGARA